MPIRFQKVPVLRHPDLLDKEINGVIDHANGSVTTPKIPDGAITSPKLDPALEITDSQHGNRAAGLHADSHERLHDLASALDHTGTITDAQHGDKTTLPDAHHPQLHAATHKAGAADELLVDPAMLTFGTWEKIAEVEPDTDVTSVAFTGLNLDKDKAYMLVFQTRNPTASSGYIRLYFNQITTSAYYWLQSLYAAGTSIGAARVNHAGWIYTLAGHDFIGWCMIERYLYPRWINIWQGRLGSALVLYCYGGNFTIDTNVIRIDLVHDVAGGIAAASRFMLFKVSK